MYYISVVMYYIRDVAWLYYINIVMYDMSSVMFYISGIYVLQ